MHRGSVWALLFSIAMYLIVGLFGAWMFKNDRMHDNILLNFLPTEIMMTIVRLLYAFVVILSYMIIIYPVRATFMEWFN